MKRIDRLLSLVITAPVFLSASRLTSAPLLASFDPTLPPPPSPALVAATGERRGTPALDAPVLRPHELRAASSEPRAPEGAARSDHPRLSADGPLEPGAVSATPLPIAQLRPVVGAWTGGPLVIHDNPESYSTSGVLGSTIAPVPGRGDGRAQLPGRARIYTLANNITGRPQVFSAVVRNGSNAPMELAVSGTLYSKKLTPTDGSISPDYIRDRFAGPHAISAHSYMAAQPARNGYISHRVTLGPGETKVVAFTPVHPGGEVFAMLDLRAGAEGQRFGVASVASERALSARDLADIEAGRHRAAGVPKNYLAAGPNRLGRPNGVVVEGSTFVGGRTIQVEAGTRTGDLVYATRFKNAGSTDEIGRLRHALPNLAGVGPAAVFSDGNYGSVHRLRYRLENPSPEPRRVEVLLTAPIMPGETVRRPLGGELTLSIKVDGRVQNVRVNARGEGRVIAELQVPAEGSRELELELAHLGNSFPPAGIEFRTHGEAPQRSAPPKSRSLDLLPSPRERCASDPGVAPPHQATSLVSSGRLGLFAPRSRGLGRGFGIDSKPAVVPVGRD